MTYQRIEDRVAAAATAQRNRDVEQAAKPAASKIDPDVRKALANADLTIVAETDAYFIYSDGTLTPGRFGTRYSLMAATFDGQRIPLGAADITKTSRGWEVNLLATSSTRDPLVLRAKADILNRMADILAAQS